MQKFKSYETAKAPQEAGERLPTGGYILKIEKAQEVTFNNGNRGLEILFDIHEGEHKGFYAENYRSQTDEDKKWKGKYVAYIPKEDGSEKDNWTASSFKGMTTAIEESNAGYHWDWDETKLKGKIVGAVFGNKEYEFNGRQGFYTDCRHFIAANKIREGKFKDVKDKPLKNKATTTSTYSSADFEEIDTDSSDLPF